MLESTVERRFCKAIKQYKGKVYKLATQKDQPDRLCILPRNVHFFAELKRPGEKPRPSQLREISRLRKLGHRVMVVDGSNWPETLSLIQQWATITHAHPGRPKTVSEASSMAALQGASRRSARGYGAR